MQFYFRPGSSCLARFASRLRIRTYILRTYFVRTYCDYYPLSAQEHNWFVDHLLALRAQYEHQTTGAV